MADRLSAVIISLVNFDIWCRKLSLFSPEMFHFKLEIMQVQHIYYSSKIR